MFIIAWFTMAYGNITDTCEPLTNVMKYKKNFVPENDTSFENVAFIN